MVWQRSGTVSVQTGSTTVAGSNVDFAASSRVGDSFIGPDGANYEVANVASSTIISILPAYKGPSVSGAAYAIMPVQGYDKMLSDAFNALNNQFGPKLAALGTTGNYDILPLDKGGNGNTTGTAQKLVAGAMVGTVSQSSGLPTGAIFERGSNANGDYIKFADGTMICRISFTSLVAMDANQIKDLGTANLPASFINTNYSVLVTASPSSSFDTYGFTTSYGASPLVIRMIYRNGSTAQSLSGIQVTCIGRWF